jgi:hypothetical protein
VQPVAMNNKVLLASYPQYHDAQAAVDKLSDAHFPVEETAIIGRDLRLVENVTGRLTRARAALAGAASGAWFGLLFGLFLGIFAVDTRSTLALAFWGLVFGALAGAVFGSVGYALTGGRRDFVSVSQIAAERYDVVVDARTADDARAILGFGAGGGARTAPARHTRTDGQDATADPADPAGADPAVPAEAESEHGRGGWLASLRGR